ncbi:hypothetical protein [Lentzea aerocolonigenes]|uniref:hypothetical protein n=1 Tax=Lentzea aerocolonigenes TaxID=68170 RepID=UPI0012E0E1AC|nr:hypothetical protein [Lentzea aerocolonigenes]
MNDFLMAAASATTNAQAEAEVPSSSERTLLAGEGGPLDSIIPAGTDNFGRSGLANPNRTKAPRQEVDR